MSSPLRFGSSSSPDSVRRSRSTRSSARPPSDPLLSSSPRRTASLQLPLSQPSSDGRVVTPSANPSTMPSPSSQRASRLRNDIGRHPIVYVNRDMSDNDFGVPPYLSDSADPVHTNSNSDGDLHRYIWGTTVDCNDLCRRFKRFLLEFIDEGSLAGTPLYPALLTEMYLVSENTLNLDCQNLRAFDATLYSTLTRFPQEVIPSLDLVANRLYADINHIPHDNFELIIKPFNLQASIPMRDLNPADIDRLIAIQGMVTRVSTIIPDLKIAFFKCANCDYTKEVGIDRNRIQEPTACPNCNERNLFSLIHNRCLFTDKQQVKLQEKPEDIPEGETPHTVNLCAFDDLVDVAKPGDRVEITGIYRAVPMRVSGRQRNVKAIYKTYIDAIHIRKLDKGRISVESQLEKDPTSEFFTSNREGDTLQEVLLRKEAEYRVLAQDPAIYSRLAASLAPSVWELEDVKKGLLLQLFGGNSKEFKEKSMGAFRGEVNVLLVGDPGTSKSQLLGYVHKIAPRGIYTSGRGSSAVGLTAYVTRDPESRDLVLESGALVLSDRGICCIDEFDKMSDSARSCLHEVMEQQTVSVAKAGIICTLHARTSVLASANPEESRYNPYRSVVENIKLPPTLLSRFDLIFLMLDKVDADTDRRLAHHIVGLYTSSPDAHHQGRGIIPKDVLTGYISFARSQITPEITDEAVTELVEGYVKMRQKGCMNKTITATPRQLESLIRLAEAHARLRLSPTVDLEDVREAIRLYAVATQQAATDPVTGTIDMDLIATGSSARGREMTAQLSSLILQALSGAKDGRMSLQDLIKVVERGDVVLATRDDVDRAVVALKADQRVATKGVGFKTMVTLASA